MKKTIIVALLGLVFLNIVVPSIHWTIIRIPDDFSTFYCASVAEKIGVYPWTFDQLQKMTGCEGTDTPFLYPPYFLLLTRWFTVIEKKTAFFVWQSVNLALGLSAIILIQRKSRASWISLLMFLSVFESPFLNFRGGQVNLTVLFLISLAVYLKNGAALTIAGAIKMSPAILLVPWVLQKKWRPLATAAATFLCLAGITCLIFSPEEQWRFFTKVLPQFKNGFLQLEIPLFSAEHHSLSRLVDGVWPSQTNGRLSRPAELVFRFIDLSILAGLTHLSWVSRKRPSVYLSGAWLAFMTIAPTFTWGAHLVFILIPIASVMAALEKNLLTGYWVVATTLALVTLMVPFAYLRFPGFYFPETDWLMRDLKLIAILTIGVTCLELHRTQNPPSSN